MKILIPNIFLTYCIFLSSVLLGLPDQYVKLGGKVTVTKESDQWVKASVPFEFVTHPFRR